MAKSNAARSRAGGVRLAPGEVHCWYASLDAPPKAFARLYATLTDDECSRAARFRFQRDRRRFIAAHGILREILGRYLRVAPDRIRYVYNAFGKPDLSPGFGSRLKFSLSHSGDAALVAVTLEANVGVDLERARGEPDCTEIARHFFSAAEVDQLRALPEHRRAEAFLRCWTKKEACLKACGGGLAISLDSFAVPVEPGPAQDPALVSVVAGNIARAQSLSVFTLQPDPWCVGALAIEGMGWRLSQRRWASPPATGGTGPAVPPSAARCA